MYPPFTVSRETIDVETRFIRSEFDGIINASYDLRDIAEILRTFEEFGGDA